MHPSPPIILTDTITCLSLRCDMLKIVARQETRIPTNLELMLSLWKGGTASMASEISRWLKLSPGRDCCERTGTIESWLWRGFVIVSSVTFFGSGWMAGWVFRQWVSNQIAKPPLVVMIAAIIGSLIVNVRTMLMWPNVES